MPDRAPNNQPRSGLDSVGRLQRKGGSSCSWLKNVSSRFIHLEFTSSQRFDVLVRDAAGRVVVQWSEDRMFEAALGSVGINPGEHLEYHAVISTRDLQPGQRYVVTALITGRDDLKVELPLVPER